MLSRLGQHAGLSRRMPRRGDHRACSKGDRRSQNRADIVRIGHLVEHQQQAGAAQFFKPDGRQRPGFQHNALMHRIRANQIVELAGQGLFEGQVLQNGRIGFEPGKGVLRRQQPDLLAPGVLQRVAHRMQPVEIKPVVIAASRRPCRVPARAPLLRVVAVMGGRSARCPKLFRFVFGHRRLIGACAPRAQGWRTSLQPRRAAALRRPRFLRAGLVAERVQTWVLRR